MAIIERHLRLMLRDPSLKQLEGRACICQGCAMPDMRSQFKNENSGQGLGTWQQATHKD
jgi:hypothetical protein